jgi:cystathionine beta-lyase/cystathionine gamma-synthase
MSAFATIVGFLQMEGKLDGPVVLGASTYHECRDLLRALVPDDELVEAPEHPTDALSSAILRHRPAAVFLDSVGNAPGTLVTDLPGVVGALEAAGRPSYLVLDNTALTCTVQPFRLVGHRRQVRLIVFESLTKYAQFRARSGDGGCDRR